MSTKLYNLNQKTSYDISGKFYSTRRIIHRKRERKKNLIRSIKSLIALEISSNQISPGMRRVETKAPRRIAVPWGGGGGWRVINLRSPSIH